MMEGRSGLGVNLLNTNETKIIYYIDDEETPYAQKLPIATDKITLADFKSILNPVRPNYKCFFKSHDDDFGPIKEEVSEDSAKLPLFKGRVVAYLVVAEGSNVSDGNSQFTNGSVRPNKAHAAEQRHLPQYGESEYTTDTDSCISSRREYPHLPKGRDEHGRAYRQPYGNCDSSSMMTSDVDSTSFADSDDDDESTSRISTTTDETSVSRIQEKHRRRRRRPRMPSLSRTSSISSITDSTTSLNIITVILNLDQVNFLGISIVGQSSNGDGDGGIYVGSIMKGGAVAIDGRVEPGDMILQVNDTNFEQMTNDEAVQVLREAVKTPGPIKLVVAKCWDPNPKGYFTINKGEPICPIDPGAWVAHTEAARSIPEGFLRPPSANTLTSNNSSLPSSLNDNERQVLTHTDLNSAIPYTDLSVEMDMLTISKAMSFTDSGLEVKDRQWLKVTIRNAFLGSDVVNWLTHCVRGLQDRSDAKKYAAQLLKFGYIKNTLNKGSFSGNCYYTFGDMICIEQLNSLTIDNEASMQQQQRLWFPPGMDGQNHFQNANNVHPNFMQNWTHYGVLGRQETNGHSSGGSGNGFDSNAMRANDIQTGSGHGSGSPSNSDQDQRSQRSGPFMINSQQQLHEAQLQRPPVFPVRNGAKMANGSTASSDLGSGCGENTYCEPDITPSSLRDMGSNHHHQMGAPSFQNGQHMSNEYAEEEDHLIIEYHYPDKVQT